MAKYVVLWANHPGLHPGDDFAPLDVSGHPSLKFWYQEYVPEAAAQKEPETIPDYWVHFAGQQPDGSWQGFRWGGELLEAANLAELLQRATSRQWNAEEHEQKQDRDDK
jgi:hypothetical protein